MVLISSKQIHVQRDDSRVSLCGQALWAKKDRFIEVPDHDSWLITCQQCLHILEKKENVK